MPINVDWSTKRPESNIQITTDMQTLGLIISPLSLSLSSPSPCRFEGLTAIGMQGFIRVVRLSEKQAKDRQKEKMDKFEKDRALAIGFRKVIDLISQSGKTVVGHNMLLDVCHMVGQFVEPLPETLPEFKTLAHRLFPK